MVCHVSAQSAAPQEYCEECPDRSRVVVRDTALRDNGALPAAFQRTAGDLLYDGLRNGLVVDGQVQIGGLPYERLRAACPCG